MGTTLKFKRGDSTAAAAFTGAEGELYINTTTDQIHVHDGSTQGGAAIMAKTASPTFTGTITLSAISANGSTGTSGQVLTSNGSSTYWAAGGGGGGSASYAVGEFKFTAGDAPGTGWLNTSSYYTKSSYANLASSLGSIPDAASVNAIPKSKFPLYGIPPSFVVGTTMPSYSTASNGNTMVQVGANSAIRYSNNGVDWVGVPSYNLSSLANTYMEVRWLNSERYVAVGLNTISTSTDGINWAHVAVPTRVTGATLTSVAYGANTYVAVGLTSTNYPFLYANTVNGGITGEWHYGAYSTAQFTRVIYGGGLFVAVGVSGTLATSADGISWTSRSSGSSNTFMDMIYTPANTYVGVGVGGQISSSSDGLTWTQRAGGLSAVTLSGVAAGNGVVVAVGNQGYIVSSADGGTTWTSRQLGASTTHPNLYSITWTGSRFIAVGTSGRYYTSTDGVTWTMYLDDSESDFIGVTTLGSNGHVAISGTTQSISLSNTNSRSEICGVKWNYTYSTPTNAQYPVAYNGANTYVLVGDRGAIYTSANGNSWSKVQSYPDATYKNQINANYTGAAYLNGLFVVYGLNGYSMRSTNSSATAFLPFYTGSANVFRVTYGGGYYVMATSTGVYYISSTDVNAGLTTWTQVTQGAATAFYDVDYDSTNQVFVATGTSLSIWINIGSAGMSSTWNQNSHTNTGYRVKQLNGYWVIMGTNGMYGYSAQGSAVSFTVNTVTGVTGAFSDAIYSGGMYILVGDTGKICTAADITINTWLSRSGQTLSNFNQIYWTGTKYVVLAISNGHAFINPSVDLTQPWYMATSATVTSTAAGYGFAYIGGTFFAASFANYVQTSTDGILWKFADNVKAYPKILNAVRKFNNVYFATTDVGVFKSSDGLAWTFIPHLNSTNARFGWNGTKYGIFHPGGSTYVQATTTMLLTSNDATTWTKNTAKASEFGGNTAIPTTTWTAAADFVGAANNWIVRFTTLGHLQNINSGLYVTGNDGTTWSAVAQGPQSNVATSFWSASNGSVATMATSTQGAGAQILKTTDGGYTWSSIGPGLASYYDEDSKWWFVDYWSSKDLVNWKPSAPLQSWHGVVSNNHCILMQSAQYGFRYYTNLKGAGGASLIPHMQVPFYPSITGSTGYGPSPITAANTFLVALQAAYDPAFAPYGYQEVNVFSYNPSTTFYVPPAGQPGAPAYIYAGT